METLTAVQNVDEIKATNKTLISLSRQKLKNMVPAAFQKAPHQKMSDKYQFISTEKIISLLEKAGFKPFRANQINYRKENDFEGYQFHKISFYHPEMIIFNTKGQIEEMFELSIANSHNGFSKFTLFGSFFRLACENGMLCLTNDLGHLVTRHMGDGLEMETKKLVETLTNEFQKMTKNVKKMKTKQLTSEKRIELAKKMAEARAFKQKGKFDYDVEKLLTPLRPADKGNSLWKTYNVIQEKLIKGFDFANGAVEVDDDKKTPRKLRAVNNFHSQMDLNKAFNEIVTEFV